MGHVKDFYVQMRNLALGPGINTAVEVLQHVGFDPKVVRRLAEDIVMDYYKRRRNGEARVSAGVKKRRERDANRKMRQLR